MNNLTIGDAVTVEGAILWRNMVKVQKDAETVTKRWIKWTQDHPDFCFLCLDPINDSLTAVCSTIEIHVDGIDVDAINKLDSPRTHRE